MTISDPLYSGRTATATGTATVSITGNVATVTVGWTAATSTAHQVQVSASFDY